ncbi:MAG TPA: YbaK/EbsC family protein [Actinomycetota bacterium]|nr:YbaK/EbsC family protein [Actinomycetota bacterium]
MTPETTSAIAALEALDARFDVRRTEPARSAEESAERQGIELHDLVKTIVLRKGSDDYVFVLVPADREIDWPKLRKHLGVSRVSIPPRQEAESVTGYVVGTITPFGAARSLPVVLDSSVAARPLIALGGGAPGVNVHIAPSDLVELLRADVADVTSPTRR